MANLFRKNAKFFKTEKMIVADVSRGFQVCRTGTLYLNFKILICRPEFGQYFRKNGNFYKNEKIIEGYCFWGFQVC